MDMRQYFKKMFAYNAWANREALASLMRADAPPRAVKVMGHIIGAERLWLNRLKGEGSAPVWPALGLDQCAAQLDALEPAWESYLNDLTPARLAQPVAYINSRGESWSNTVEDILTHLAMHSAYHRGQIASELRAAGLVPAHTDYIHAIRQELIKNG
jgi:uncharacterized damage-inducible protein DinB